MHPVISSRSAHIWTALPADSQDVLRRGRRSNCHTRITSVAHGPREACASCSLWCECLASFARAPRLGQCLGAYPPTTVPSLCLTSAPVASGASGRRQREEARGTVPWRVSLRRQPPRQLSLSSRCFQTDKARGVQGPHTNTGAGLARGPGRKGSHSHRQNWQWQNLRFFAARIHACESDSEGSPHGPHHVGPGAYTRTRGPNQG